MAPQVRPGHPLRLITNKIANTPVERLPLVLSYFENILQSCGDYLKGAGAQSQSKDRSETGVLLHKYKTQVSTLLQGKDAAGRWCAVVLVKATIEAGGLSFVQESTPWVRALLGYLSKKDSPATRTATIIALTKIFVLTGGKPAVIREITTPSLPPFITSCLNCISTSSKGSGQTSRDIDHHSPLLKVVLQSFITLFPRHPASFRPFLAQLRSILSHLIAPTPSTLLSSDSPVIPESCPSIVIRGLAQMLQALLPHSAPRNGSAEEWNKAVRDTIAHAHGTANHVFQAVLEENSNSHILIDIPGTSNEYPGSLGHRIDDTLGLPAWQGIDAGSERLIGCLQILQAYLATSTPTSVSIPIGLIWSLTERMLSVFGPSSASAEVAVHSAINPQIDRNERESLWARLPEIHEAAINTLWVIIERLDLEFMSHSYLTIDRLAWVFQREQEHGSIRRALYRVASQLIRMVGPSMPRPKVLILRPLIQAACEDILPFEAKSNERQAVNAKQKDSSKVLGQGVLLQSKQVVEPIMVPTDTPLYKAASGLLEVTLSRIRSEVVPVPLRALIDRTIILTRNEAAMTASVLNPPRSSPNDVSILPFLARAFPSSAATEAILRPRMPVIRGPAKIEQEEEIAGEGEEDESRFAQSTSARPYEESVQFPRSIFPDTTPVGNGLFQAAVPTQSLSSKNEDILMLTGTGISRLSNGQAPNKRAREGVLSAPLDAEDHAAKRPCAENLSGTNTQIESLVKPEPRPESEPAPEELAPVAQMPNPQHHSDLSAQVETGDTGTKAEQTYSDIKVDRREDDQGSESSGSEVPSLIIGSDFGGGITDEDEDEDEDEENSEEGKGGEEDEESRAGGDDDEEGMTIDG